MAPVINSAELTRGVFFLPPCGSGSDGFLLPMQIERNARAHPTSLTRLRHLDRRFREHMRDGAAVSFSDVGALMSLAVVTGLKSSEAEPR